jgi:hypothetical protein
MITDLSLHRRLHDFKHQTTLGSRDNSAKNKSDTTHNLSRNRRRWGQWKSRRKTIIQNMAYAQQSQKLETGIKIIANSKT